MRQTYVETLGLVVECYEIRSRVRLEKSKILDFEKILGKYVYSKLIYVAVHYVV